MSKSEDPVRLAEILDALKSRSRLGVHLDQAQIWERWPELVGAEMAERSHPMRLRRGVLTVAAVSPVWMHRFSYEKNSIIDKINKILTKEPLEDIFLTLPGDEGIPGPETQP
jgi:predicted nucleic acid-binding Zn ribbon protein